MASAAGGFLADLIRSDAQHGHLLVQDLHRILQMQVRISERSFFWVGSASHAVRVFLCLGQLGNS